MSEHPFQDRHETNANARPLVDEGGLHAPPNLSLGGKIWWWFDFLILVNLARLRFIGILVLIGLVIVKWAVLVGYYDKWTRPARAEETAASDVEYYCPMHPTVIRDNAKEKCPICQMPLSRRKKSSGQDKGLPPGIVSRVQLSPYRIVLAGIKTSKVSHEPLFKKITTVGFVEFDERESKQVAARVKGRLDKLFVSETGEMVYKDQELASLYSPELVVTVENLLDAQRNHNAGALDNARDRLRLWGISEDQVKEILTTGKANTHLKIRSPIEGHVLKKYVKEGQYVDEGSPLYDIVDLAKVWILAQVYEEDMPFLPVHHRALTKEEAVKIGLPVSVTTRAFPGQPFDGNVTFVYPHVDQESRTILVRAELDNPGHKLRPGTSATVQLRVPSQKLDFLDKAWADNWLRETSLNIVGQALTGPGGNADLGPFLRASVEKILLAQGLVLAVPDSAVIDTGSLRVVYREVPPGQYEGVEVEAGLYEGVEVELGPSMTRRQGGVEVAYFPVLRGLNPGDTIVTAGSFLLDAETRLNPAAGSIYLGGSSGSKPGTGRATIRPSTPANKEAKTKGETEEEKAIRETLAQLPGADPQLAAAQRFARC